MHDVKPYPNKSKAAPPAGYALFDDLAPHGQRIFLGLVALLSLALWLCLLGAVWSALQG